MAHLFLDLRCLVVCSYHLIGDEPEFYVYWSINNMGNCFRDCYDVYFASEYTEIPDDDANARDVKSDVMSETSGESMMTRDTILPVQLDMYYEIGPIVGIGTTSKVHLVKRKNLHWKDNQQLVCKIINKHRIVKGVEDSDIDPLLDLLCREVEILKMIHHDNVVKYYDFMQSKDKLFIITERLEGGELFEYIITNGPLKEEFTNRIMYGVFAAVAYLHERGIVHRDIKAENLLFHKSSGGEDVLKLIDFGFSTLLDSDSTLSFIGTGGYIAPEIRQRRAYSTEVDNWSLGVLLFCTLSAKLPFDVSLDKIPDSLESCRGSYELVFAPKSWSHISDECKDLIARLLEVNPERRLTANQALHHPWFRGMHAKQAMCKTSEQPVLLGSLEGELDVEAFSGYQTSCSTSADSRSDRLLELVG